MKTFRSSIALLVIILSSVCVHAQDNLRNELFGDVNVMIAQVKEKNAELYAPSSLEKGMKYYNEAAEYFSRGKSVEDVREKLKDAAAYFAKALDACKLGEVTFSATMSARTDANSAGAPKFSTELWNKAEVQFKDAARRLEDGDASSAKETGALAEASYRAAELEAIKANYLSPARELLKKADDLGVAETAPKTLGKARRLAATVEELLKHNRYDTDSARQLAREAKYEAAHSLYLYQTITRMTQQNMNLEDAMLAAEASFQRVTGFLGFQGRFDNGYDSTVNAILAAFKERDTKDAQSMARIMKDEETIKQKDEEINNLKQQVGLMENRLGSLTEAEKKLKDEGTQLQQKLLVQQQQEETIQRVASMFGEEEGSVLRDGDNIIIRLYGLTFPSGKNTIEPQYYSFLTKVQEAIKKFPNCSIAIEGHTDSQGSDEANQKLSESRAKAVAEYLMANMNVDIPINHHGYGESRPVASNDTPEGRAKNRRIDVVITPAWAGK